VVPCRSKQHIKLFPHEKDKDKTLGSESTFLLDIFTCIGLLCFAVESSKQEEQNEPVQGKKEECERKHILKKLTLNVSSSPVLQEEKELKKVSLCEFVSVWEQFYKAILFCPVHFVLENPLSLVKRHTRNKIKCVLKVDEERRRGRRRWR